VKALKRREEIQGELGVLNENMRSVKEKLK